MGWTVDKPATPAEKPPDPIEDDVVTDTADQHDSGHSPWFTAIVALFVTTLIISNIIAVKLIDVAGTILPAAIIIFPISYIVGDVTIELARMIDKAIPGQVMVGDFQVDVPDKKTEKIRKIGTVEFLERTQKTLSNLKGLVLSGDAVDSINCYLTGDRKTDGSFSIKKYLVTDKHNLTRNVYNAKINIYRENAAPIFIGVQDQELGHLEFTAAE